MTTGDPSSLACLWPRGWISKLSLRSTRAERHALIVDRSLLPMGCTTVNRAALRNDSHLLPSFLRSVVVQARLPCELSVMTPACAVWARRYARASRWREAGSRASQVLRSWLWWLNMLLIEYQYNLSICGWDAPRFYSKATLPQNGPTGLTLETTDTRRTLSWTQVHLAQPQVLPRQTTRLFSPFSTALSAWDRIQDLVRSDLLAPYFCTVDPVLNTSKRSRQLFTLVIIKIVVMDVEH